jgi:hypothetical protein
MIEEFEIHFLLIGAQVNPAWPGVVLMVGWVVCRTVVFIRRPLVY